LLPIIYLRPEDFCLEELDLEPDDLDTLCDDLLFVADPELTDLEEERTWGALIVLDDRELLAAFERTLLPLPAFERTLLPL
jgi:hypothetical protein